MSEQQGILTAPIAAGANLGFGYSVIPWFGSTAYALPNTLRDPITGAGAFVTVANALKVDGSAVVQPVSISALPALPAGSNLIGSVSISGTPNVTASVSNFPASYGTGSSQSGTGQFVPIADAYAPINAATNGITQLIAGVAGKRIYVTGFDFISNTSGLVQFVEGSSNTAITGPYPVTAETGVSRGNGIGAIWALPVGESLSISLSSGASAYGSVSYTVY